MYVGSFAPVVLFLVWMPACAERGGSRDAGRDVAAATMTDAGVRIDASTVSLGGNLTDAGPLDEDLPSSNSSEIVGRLQHLFEAVAQRKPELASDILFPRDAYLEARDVPDAARAWEHKILTAFSKDVKSLHRKIRPSDKIEIVGFELGHSVTQIAPRKHEFKKPLWRVKRSKVTYTQNGKTQELILSEMTSWRGAWYVTNLK